MRVQQLNSLKTVSKVGDLSPAIIMTAHFFFLVRSLRSSRWDSVSLVKSVTYFDLIGLIGGRGYEFQHSKYKFSSHPKTRNSRTSVR